MVLWKMVQLTRQVVIVLLYLCVNGGHCAISESTLRKYLQPNDVTSGKYDFLTTATAEKRKLCTRPCDNATAMICYYTFVLENYNTVGPACGNCTLVADSPGCERPQCVSVDGVERPVLTVNRQIPAPSIQVCPGDLIIVDVINKMFDRAVTIHWHGLYQQKTPWMDGVPGVTQCPILPATTFRYKFPAVPFGTFFYHSHQGLQKMDGIVGSLIIKRPRLEDPHSILYDFDLPSHVLLVTDWLHTMMDSRLPGNRFSNIGGTPDSTLANGRTQYFYANGTGTKAPYSVFKVTVGKRYRFRLIGGICSTCPVLVAFEKHPLLFIASDGTPAQPVAVDSVTLLSGERFDVVLHANQTIASYWIKLKGLGVCAQKAATYAVLQYASARGKSSTSTLPHARSITRGVNLNPVDNSNCSATTDLCMSRLNAAIPPPVATILKAKPDQRITLAIDFYTFNVRQLFTTNTFYRWLQVFPGSGFAGLINNESYIQTPFSLLTQNLPLPDDLNCKKTSNCGKKAPEHICECTHIIQVTLNSIVELVFIDFTIGNTILAHPLHLHGTDMHIMKQGKIPDDMTPQIFLPRLIQELDREGPNLARTRPKPIVKDTVGNLPSGYTVVRVHFDNPGMWYFHCHFILHSDVGMTLVFQVGDRSQFVKPPPHFPICDNFLPAVSQGDLEAARALKKTAVNSPTSSTKYSEQNTKKNPSPSNSPKQYNSKGSPRTSNETKAKKTNSPTKLGKARQAEDDPEVQKFVNDVYDELRGR